MPLTTGVASFVNAVDVIATAASVVSSTVDSPVTVAVFPAVSVMANDEVMTPSVKEVRSTIAVPSADTLTLTIFAGLAESVKVTTPVASLSRPDTVNATVLLAESPMADNIMVTAASELTSAMVSVTVVSTATVEM